MTTAEVQTVTFEQVLTLAQQLPPKDQIRLVARLTPMFEYYVSPVSSEKPKSLYGTLAHLVPAPSEEDIAEVRREMWQNFPREDV